MTSRDHAALEPLDAVAAQQARLLRELEPEVMDDLADSLAYAGMEHSAPNAAFVARLIELGAAGRMLDLGTGPGHIPVEVCRRIRGATVLAVDPAQSMLELAAERVEREHLADRIELQRADAKGLSLPSASFDVVFSNTVLHHIPEPVAFLREAARVCRPGGAFLVRDLFRPGSRDEVAALVRLHAAQETPEQRELFRASLCAALTPHELRRAADLAGLRDAEVVIDSDRHMSLQRAANAMR